MKLCKDCKHAVITPHVTPWCKSPRNGIEVDFVTGDTHILGCSCNTNRSVEDTRILWWSRAPKWLCGKEAHWFEPKEKSPD